MDIRAAVTHQHYDQEYNFPKLDPLFLPSRAIELIPEAAPKHGGEEVFGVDSGGVHTIQPLPSILLANVQSLDNKVDKLRARISFQRDIRDCNILCFTESWLFPGYTVPVHTASWVLSTLRRQE